MPRNRRIARAHSRACGGFTILEVFVCFGIIMVLLTLLLPAVSAARQAALRVQCSNNLKQLGLALTCYHETFGVFPPGYVARDVAPEDPSDVETGSGYGWGCLILGFLEQQAQLSSIPFELDADDPTASSVGGTIISPFVCAADSGEMVFSVQSSRGTFMLGALELCRRSGLWQSYTGARCSRGTGRLLSQQPDVDLRHHRRQQQHHDRG